MDGGQAWTPFVPTRLKYRIETRLLDEYQYLDYIKQEDWSKLTATVFENTDTEATLETLSYAHQLLDSGNIRHAFIEAVTAFELALDNYLNRHFGQSQAVADSVRQFKDKSFSNKAKISLIGLGLKRVSMSDIELAVTAVDTRNKITHRGFRISEEHIPEVRALLSLVAEMLPGPRIRFPRKTSSGEMWASKEYWDQLLQQHTNDIDD